MPSLIQWTSTWSYSTVGSLTLPQTPLPAIEAWETWKGLFPVMAKVKEALSISAFSLTFITRSITQLCSSPTSSLVFLLLPMYLQEALFVALHVLFQLQLQPSFGFPYSAPLLKYQPSSAWSDGTTAQCNLLTNPPSVECFLEMLFRKGGCFSSISHLLKVASICRCLFKCLFSWYCGKCHCSKFFFIPLFSVVSWFVSSNLKFGAEEKEKEKHTHIHLIGGNQTIHYLHHVALTANPFLQDFL